MRVLLKDIDAQKDVLLYDFYQKIPADECGFKNDAYGLSPQEFAGYLQKKQNSSQGINLKPNRVPSTEYILYIDDNPVGIGRVRHYLTEELLKHAGHISFAILPEFRGLHYAAILLALLLEKARTLKLNKVLLTCNENNVGSYKTIEKNGGKLEKIENKERFYWIDLA